MATVFVQAGAFLYKQSTPPEFQGLGEVEFCQGIAAMTSSQIYGNTRINCGIQGSVDLTHPNCENVLKAMMGSRNFRGVRGYMPNRNDDYNDDFKRGMRILEKYDLVLDRWDENVENIPQLTRLAKEFPNVRIVLDHLGGAVGPNLSPVEVEQWKKDITEIGKRAKNLAPYGPDHTCVISTTLIPLRGRLRGFDFLATELKEKFIERISSLCSPILGAGRYEPLFPSNIMGPDGEG